MALPSHPPTPKLPFVFALLLTLGGCAVGADDALDPSQLSQDDEEGGTYVPLGDGKADGFEHSTAHLTLSGACDDGDRLTIAAVGDVLLHSPLQRQAYSDPNGFTSLWEEVAPLLAQADVAYANLEGPTAAGVNANGHDVPDPGPVYGENGVYTTYPQFNYHPSLIPALQDAGIDVVSTANNHALDRRSLGVDRTIDALREAGLPFTGTRKSDDARRDFVAYTEARGFRLAWIACTFGTNGIPDRDDQVLHCYDDRQELLDLVQRTTAERGVDAVMVTPHWGVEYEAMPRQRQITLARDLVEAGALAVIGSHPHVLQPWQRIVTADGREGFVIYSLGNFVSNQTTLAKRSTLLLYLGLVRDRSGEVKLTGARFVPLYMLRSERRRIVPIDPRATSYRDSLDLTLSLFGGSNLMRADETLVCDPECDPRWSPPRLTPSFVGDACTADADCDFATDAFCHSAGFCTVPCDGYCDDLAGHAPTFCAEDGPGGGLCLSQASTQNDQCGALPGADAQTRARYIGDSGAAPAEAVVCAP